MGPPPKPASLQRRPGRGLVAGQTLLPARGRVGRRPKWPLPAGVSPAAHQRELEIWARLWKLPQSVEWERMGFGVVDVVARYCRLAAQAETRGAKGTVLNEVRQLEDRLGLTPMSMARLRWTISPAVGEDSEKVADIRERMKAVAD